MVNAEELDFMKKTKEVLDLINSVGPEKFAQTMSPQVKKIENMLQMAAPFVEENVIKIIATYGVILDGFYSSEKGEKELERERYEHLFTACFAVGYALGIGKESTSVLPIMSLAGAYLGIGKKVLGEYNKV